MYEYENIEAAAHHRDWQECAGIMFGLLYRCATEGQRNVAREALRTYVVIWNTKHEDVLRQLPQLLLTPEIHGKRPKLPEFPEDLDPADAEFENGLIEYYNGAFFSANHGQHTMEFATAIRSAVVARQINKWLSNLTKSHLIPRIRWRLTSKTDTRYQKHQSHARFVQNVSEAQYKRE